MWICQEKHDQKRVGIMVRLWGIPGVSPFEHVLLDKKDNESAKKDEICGCELERRVEQDGFAYAVFLPIPPCSSLPIVGSFDKYPLFVSKRNMEPPQIYSSISEPFLAHPNL